MAHVATWQDARTGDVITGGCNGPMLIVARQVRRKRDAEAQVAAVRGHMLLDGLRTWAVALYLEPCK